MRNLVIILLAISLFSFSPKEESPYIYVFAIPNAVGDGVANDTAALQAWFDGTTTGTPTGSETYRITSTINIDQSGMQIRDLNGATILGNTEFTRMFLVEKPSGEFIPQNTTLDGGGIVDEGIFFRTQTSGFNLTIKNFHSDGSRAVALRSEISNAANRFGTYDFLNTEIDNIYSVGDGTIGSVDGVARAYWHRWIYNKTNTTIRFIGGNWSNIWGDDGDHIQIDGNDDSAGSTSETQFIGLTLSNSNRRILKGTAYNIGLYSCILTAPPANHPEVLRTTQTAMVAFGFIGDGASQLGYGHKLINCTITGTGGNSSFTRISNTKTTDMVVNGCTITDMDFAFTKINATHAVSGVQIINNTCSNVDIQSNPSYGNNTIGIGNNTGLSTAGAQAGAVFTISSPDPLITCFDGIQNGSETGIDVGGACSLSNPAPTTKKPRRRLLKILMQ